MNWVAIDFETANAKRSSACALGIAIVENGRIIKRASWLIKPRELYSAGLSDPQYPAISLIQMSSII